MTTTTVSHAVARPRPSFGHAPVFGTSAGLAPSSWHVDGTNATVAAVRPMCEPAATAAVRTIAIGGTTKRPHPGRLETVT